MTARRNTPVPHNTDRILTTHVGSLIRPPKLIAFWRSIEDGKPYDEAAFEACLTESVAEVVRQQAEVGIDIASDGEFSKGVNWAFYIFKRLKGIAVRTATPEELDDPMASMAGGQDRAAFPEFYAEYDAATGLSKRLGYRVVVNGAIAYCGHNQVGRDIKNISAGLAAARQQNPALAGFLPVVAPASALPGAKIEHYKDEESYLFALAEALHQEYKAIVDAGLYVQIDDAFLPYMHERMVPPMSNAQYLHWAQMRVVHLTMRCGTFPKSARAITSVGVAGTARTPSTCHLRTLSACCCRCAPAITHLRPLIRATLTSGACVKR